MPPAQLDVITIGRCSVDLYGQQIGSRLEDIGSFRQISRRLPGQYRNRHGAAGLAVGALSRVGDEQMGAFHPRAARRARAWRQPG
jgi:5-dehydro-2-deoxygluconokinase